MKLCVKALATIPILALASLGAAKGITVTVDGNDVYFPDAKPQMVNGRVMVPMRGVFAELGATMSWQRRPKRVIAHRGETRVQLRVGQDVALVNGRRVALDAPPVVSKGRVLVPLRFISESLGAKVRWNAGMSAVHINTGWGELPPQ